MREILFRGKRKYTDEWVYGDLIHRRIAGTDIIIIRTEDSGFDNYVDFTVIPETVGQYTGFTDKNGKRIFEGDILKGFEYPFFRKEDGTHNYFAEVVWFDNSPAFGLWTFKNPESTVSGISDGNTDYMENFESEIWEVIGNIHDNPELLEGVQ